MTVAPDPPTGRNISADPSTGVSPGADAPQSEDRVLQVDQPTGSPDLMDSPNGMDSDGPTPLTRSAPGEPLDLLASGEEAPVVVDQSATKSRKKSGLRTLVEWVLVLGGALAAALIIQATFLKAFYIPSGSMEPTLEINDRVLVNKLSYNFGNVQRGDIIVFHKPDTAPPSEVDDFIKRVVAIEGDMIEDRDGIVYVNGVVTEEGFLAAGTVTRDLPLQEVPENHVFVLGDNRDHSVDSRVFGPVPEGSIVGEAIFRVWPIGDIGRV